MLKSLCLREKQNLVQLSYKTGFRAISSNHLNRRFLNNSTQRKGLIRVFASEPNQLEEASFGLLCELLAKLSFWVMIEIALSPFAT